MNRRRPSERAYSALPVLGERRHELETCVFCPKLCRTSCAVSNAEPRETLTPWGKMSSAYFMARGDVEIDGDFAKTAWACTGCGACESFCHLKNPVASTLYDARAALFERGFAPPPAKTVVSEFPRKKELFRARMTRLNAHHRTNSKRARILLLAGCTHTDPAVDDALVVVQRLVGESVALAPLCCGEELRAAGARPAFEAHQEDVRAYLRGFRDVFVLDPLCEASLRTGKIETTAVATLLARHVGELRSRNETPPRQHDVARDEGDVRRVLLRLFGSPPREFETRGGVATGGLLPLTMPHIAEAIGKARAEEHARLGGGVLTTSSGAEAAFLRTLGVDARDFISLARNALRTDVAEERGH